jgi:hypothetical protein
MQPVVTSRPAQHVPLGVRVGVRIAVLLLPATLLLVASVRSLGQPHVILWLGCAFQILLCCLLFLGQRAWRRPLGTPAIGLYLVALGWLWLGTESFDWFPHFAQAILLVVPLVIFSAQVLTDSGALSSRHARRLAQALADRRDWPLDLAGCRALPEVKALREALHVDASPALALLQHPRVQVRFAALAALEFRRVWLPGQAELVLNLAQRAPEPAIRAAAITALGNVDDRSLVETLGEFLRDPAPEVRRAATEALLWDTERRWGWIRHAVRRALADPSLQDDGPLRHEGQPLKAEAVADLTAWATEKGLLGIRAALTLAAHYSRALAEQPDPALIQELKEQLADPHASPPLRMELAQLFRSNGELDPALQEGLLDPANPAPLRLLAADCLLAEGAHSEALAALREVARLPNREIALSTAELVQRRLGVDLGLAVGQPLPAIHSRLAAEVTRRVMLWAAQPEAKPRAAVPLTSAPAASEP